MSTTPESEDFFRSRLDQMIDLRRPLPQLTLRMPWQALEASIAHLFARKARAGQRIDDMDLFGGSSGVVGGGISNGGRPRVPLRMMISLLYLKHACNESKRLLGAIAISGVLFALAMAIPVALHSRPHARVASTVARRPSRK